MKCRACSSHEHIIIVAPFRQSSRRNKTRELPDMYYTSTTGHRQEVSKEPSDAFRIVLFVPVVDRIISEFRCRFSDQSLDIVSSVVSPSSPKFLICYQIVPLLSVYAETYVINKLLLKAEMSVALNLLKHDLGDRLSTCKQFCLN